MGHIVYPVRQGFEEANNRLGALIANGHHAEALLSSVFSLEKTIRRCLRHCALNRGFSSRQCDQLFENMGFQKMKDVWPVFERNHRTLPDFLGNAVWQHIPSAVEMRNKMVHGVRVYQLNDCKEKAEAVQRALQTLREKSIIELGCDPWSQLPSSKKSNLGWLDLKQPVTKSK
jgi:hypothetical protein